MAEGNPQCDDLERRLAESPMIAVPTITLDGDSDGVAPASGGTSYAGKFTGKPREPLPMPSPKSMDVDRR
jgi:hypothetical protein